MVEGMLPVDCPACGTEMAVPDFAVDLERGTEGRCPTCGVWTRIGVALPSRRLVATVAPEPADA